jgi:hypothetical protein
MKILVERFDSGSEDTFGRLYIDGHLKCYTLEDEYRKVKVKGDTRIPAGTYKVGFHDSPSHGPKALHVKDVPGFTYILIHPGNTEDHTMGCLLPGKRIGKLNGKRAVLDSKQAYKEIYPIIAGAIDRGEDVEIKYMDDVK